MHAVASELAGVYSNIVIGRLMNARMNLADEKIYRNMPNGKYTTEFRITTSVVCKALNERCAKEANIITQCHVQRLWRWVTAKSEFERYDINARRHPKSQQKKQMDVKRARKYTVERRMLCDTWRAMCSSDWRLVRLSFSGRVIDVRPQRRTSDTPWKTNIMIHPTNVIWRKNYLRVYLHAYRGSTSKPDTECSLLLTAHSQFGKPDTPWHRCKTVSWSA